MNSKNIYIGYCLLIVLIAIYMISNARYGFNLDDPNFFLDIYAKKPILEGFRPEIGRFYPLAFMDLNLLMRFSSSPYVYWAMNALCFVCSALCLWHLVKKAGANNALAFVLCVVCLCNLPVVTVIFGICYPEKWLIIALFGFLFASYALYSALVLVTSSSTKKPCNTMHIAILMLCGLVSANICLYLKESSFIIIGSVVCGFMLICMLYRMRIAFAIWLYHMGLLVSVGVFLGIYVGYIMPHTHARYDVVGDMPYMLFLLKGIVRFSVFDAKAVIFVPLLACMLCYLAFNKRITLHPFWDSLLLASVVYVGFFVAMGFWRNYYLAPVYMLAAGGVARALMGLYKRYVALRVCSVAMGVLALCSSIPLGLHVATYEKAQAINVDESIKFMHSYITQSNHNVQIYFEGIGRGDEFTLIIPSIFHRTLKEIYGLEGGYDLLVKDINTSSNASLAINPLSPFTFYNSHSITQPKSGDIIIYTSFARTNPRMLDVYLSRDELLFRTHHVAFPYIGPISLAKYAMATIRGGGGESSCSTATWWL